MTDKEKIRAEVEMRLSHHLAFSGKFKGFKSMADEDKAILSFIDSLQEETVRGDFEMALAEMIHKSQCCVIEPWVVAAQWKDELLRLAKEEPVSVWHDANHPPEIYSNILVRTYDNIVESTEDVDACNIQYASIDGAIKAHAEDYSFNIESELFQQLTPEQQKMWRKEIERAVLSGAYSGLNLARDERYEENRQEESVSEELKDEIDAWCRKVITGLPIVKEAARHFADWQKQQMMKDAIECPIILSDKFYFMEDEEKCSEIIEALGCKHGDKVKLIIIKED